MKNLFLIVVMTFSGMIAQNDKFVFPENQQSDLNKQQLVFEVAGTPKELYHKTINFLEKIFPNLLPRPFLPAPVLTFVLTNCDEVLS